MDLWSRFARYIPAGADRREIKSLEAAAAANTDDARAAAHIDLWHLYRRKAARTPILATPFRYLAREHLEAAVLWSKLLPQPLETLAGLQIEEGNLLEAVRNLTQAAVRRLDLMETGRMSADPDRLALCQTLTLGGEILSRFGHFEEAYNSLNLAFLHFRVLVLETRQQQSGLEDYILFGIVFCLQQQFKFKEASDFIEKELKGEMFAAYQSDARKTLRALGSVLPRLAEIMRDPQFPASGATLWADAMDEIQRCETPESARQVKRDVLTKIRTHDVNKEVGKLADAILSILEKQRAQMEQTAPRPLIPVKPIKIESPDLSNIKGPEEREIMRKKFLALEALAAVEEEKRRANEEAHQFVLKLHQDALDMNRYTIARVREASQRAYEVPTGFWVRWTSLNISRFVVQLVAVAYVLEEVIRKLVEEKAERLLVRLHFERHQIIFAAGLLVVGFVVGGFAEKKIDEAALDRYKEMLKELVTGRMHALWAAYNGLLKTYAQAVKDQNDPPVPPAKPTTPQGVA